jgi:branched-chain amino acid:cation transporter, LIVCS family
MTSESLSEDRVKQRLKWSDTTGLGLMIFSFFLGAGNLIFPPLAGQSAGWHVGWTLSGFMLSGVLLPLAAIVAIAHRGSFSAMLCDLPQGVKVTVTLTIFSLIGPLLITPRTGLVVYDLVFKPLLPDAWSGAQFAITVAFFTLTLLFCWRRGRLIDRLGKIVTPVLCFLLLGLTAGVVLMPQSAVQSPQAAYQVNPLIAGLIDGYQTMDIFGALMFGSIIIEGIRSKGITDYRRSSHYLVRSGLMAAMGLTWVYISLFWLGATSTTVAPQAATGTQILTAYVQALFGSWGQGLLGIVIILACLTTAIGLLSGFANYLASLTSRSYHFWIVLSAMVSALIANLELTMLITLSQPVLCAFYPAAISLVILTFVRHKLAYPVLSSRLVLSLACLSGLLDALRIMGVNLSSLGCIPGFEQGVGWVIPLLSLLLILYCVPTACVEPSTSD